MTRAPILTPLVIFAVACGGKPPEASGPIEGWHQEAAWPAACWAPPAWDTMPSGARKLARTEALKAMMSQWTGQHDSVVSFDEAGITSLETVLLGEPDKIEEVSVDNYERCRSAMAAGGDTVGWARWIGGLPAKLTEGQCPWRPLDYTLFDYLDIAQGWQIEGKVCEGDTIRIRSSSVDYYRLSDDGDWINAEGDTSKSAVGTSLPCNLEGCFEGQLILRYTTVDGIETIFPVGLEKQWTVPAHGTIEVRINDDGTFYDNTFKVEGSIEHHTSIEYNGAL